MRNIRSLLALFLILILSLFAANVALAEAAEEYEEIYVEEDGWYDTVDEVAEYLLTFGHLPDNFITEDDARALGWDNKSVKLDEVAPGMSIGGGTFSNKEGKLPSAEGRIWYICDINASYGERGAERLMFSNDGLIYYTPDYYETIELIYGDPDAYEYAETEEAEAPAEEAAAEPQEDNSGISEDGWYDTKDEVALYIHLYGHLPGNYISKKDAEALGWDNYQVRLPDVAPGKSIGGSRFGNYEGVLPDKKGRVWTECDIDASEGYRGKKRIVFSNDGLIYYTDDHYETFTQLY